MPDDYLGDAGSLAARLLETLGHSVSATAGALAVKDLPPMAFHPTTPAQDWADSGAMALTGAPGRAVRYCVGRPATVAKGAALAFAALTGVAVDGPALLGERAALMDLRGRGRISAGGGTRLLPSSRGWWALNLARDRDLVPALTEGLHPDDDAWAAVTRWGRSRTGPDILARTTSLGMAASILGESLPAAEPWRIISSVPARSAGTHRPVVVNFGALWAAPLAGNLLSLAGFDVIDVESSTRPDPTRFAAPLFYDHLHSGSSPRTMDFRDEQALRELVSSADIVIEASRPRAFAALGIDHDRILGDGRARTWIRMSGHADPNRIAFGDDAAVAGGLVAWDDEGPVFCGDAIADPLTGLLAALVVAGTHSRHRTSVVNIAMSTVSAYCGGSINRLGDTTLHVAEPHIASRQHSRSRPST